ncbi:MAG TPA: hypothetical protein QGH10_15440, partial [Armatimonadota bacterium]|nr:hypothetical protein [Armatimonadota bacterium]
GMGGPGGPGGGMPPGGGPGMGGGGQGGQGWTQMLEGAGGTPEDGEKLTAYVEARRSTQTPVREAQTALREALTDESASDEKIAQALAAYDTAAQSATSELKTSRDGLVTDLDLANRPRLKAALTVAGLLDTNASGGRGGRGGGRGGRGGPGGGMGGPGGGMGGGPGGPGGGGMRGMGGKGGGGGKGGAQRPQPPGPPAGGE